MAGTSLHHSTNPFTDAEHSGHSAVPLSDTGTCGGDDGIPVVDFDVLVNGAADQRAQAIRDLGRACEDWGFFMVINHGVPEELKEAAMETSKELFSLPEEEKAEHLEARPMDPIRIGTGFFSVVDGVRYWRDYLKMFAHPELHCPAKPAKLRDVAAEYAAATRGLLLQLAKAISESLGLDGGRISEAMDLGSCFQILVANHYPPCTGPDGVGMGMPRALRPRLPHSALPERRRRAPGRARRAVAPRQTPPRRVLRHRRRPVGDLEQREIQGRAPPSGGRRRAREDVHGEHDLAVPGHRGRADPEAGGTRRPGPQVPGRQVQRLHGASAEQQAQRESGAGHRAVCSRA
ncbi:unnamed protein product [Urochloa humidicola]